MWITMKDCRVEWSHWDLKKFKSGTKGNEIEMQKLWSGSEGLIVVCDKERCRKEEDHWRWKYRKWPLQEHWDICNYEL